MQSTSKLTKQDGHDGAAKNEREDPVYKSEYTPISESTVATDASGDGVVMPNVFRVIAFRSCFGGDVNITNVLLVPLSTFTRVSGNS